MEKSSYRWRLVVLGLMVAFTLSIHHMVLPFPHWIHLLHRRLCYFPIVLGGLWFGLRGGLVVSALISAATLPLMLRFPGPLSENQDFLEILFYLGIGALSGLLVDWREAERSRREVLQARLADSERLAAMGRMAAGVAHEVRTPLGSIQGSAEILAEDYPQGHPKRAFYDILMQEVGRLNHVVQDFLDLGRPMAVRAAEVEVGPAVEECFWSLKGSAEQRGVVLGLSAEPGCVSTADASRLHQALTNLVRNAIQASPEGGRVDVAVQADEAGCAITVEDEGPGLSEGEQERLFEPFFTRRKGGTGLGLALVKQIAEAHGGWVKGENREGKGARFRLWLPSRKEPR